MPLNRRRLLTLAAAPAAYAYGVRVTATLNAGPRELAFNFDAPGPPALHGHDRLPIDWYRHKVQQVQEKLAERKLDALVIEKAVNVIYTVGYFHRSTERPLVLLVPAKGDPTLFIPALEEDQVRAWWVQDIDVYFDYPGPVDRTEWIFAQIGKRGYAHKRIGTEEHTPSVQARIGRALPHTELVGGADAIVNHLRYIKDDAELAIMRRAMQFADFSVQAARKYIERHGSVSEEAILKASADAVTDKMARELTDIVGVEVEHPFDGMVPFGPRSALPHPVPDRAARLKPGDPLILSYGCQVGGYNVECERSFVVGKPSDRARRMYDAMLAAHDVATQQLKEGAIAEDVDAKALDEIRKAGLGDMLRHRTGHGIGLEGHEPPWIAEGDRTVLASGMVFSAEPGVYDPAFGGFRHSDTVIVHREGGEVLNRYPTRLEDMVIRV